MSSKILNIACIIFGVGMIIFGANKLFPFIPMPEMTEEQMTLFGAFGTIKWLMPLVAVGEIVGGVLMIFKKTRALGAIVIFPIIVGILLHHLTHDPAGIFIPIFFAAIDIWTIVDSKEKYMPMLG